MKEARKFLGLVPAVVVAALIATAVPTAWAASPATVMSARTSVQWRALQQSIAGFGASGAFGQAANLMFMPPQTQTKILNLLFSTKDGAGLSIVRSLINDGVDGQSIEPSPGHWDFNLSGDDQIWLMHQAQKYGVETFMSTPWSPPAWMKANHSVVGGPGETDNVLLPKYYHAYAEYLAQYVNGYWSHFHIRISALSLQNEPDQNVKYASCIWTPDQFHTFIKQDLIPVFAANHVHTQVVMPEQSFWGEQYAWPTLSDPQTARAVQIVAAHGYGGTITPLSMAQSLHKQVWETEDSTFTPDDSSITDGLNWAITINQYLTIADVSAWNYWWLVNSGVDNEGLININTFNDSYTVNKRLYTLGNFSRFIRPRFNRISTSSDLPAGVSLSAYRDVKTGDFALVVINDTAHRIPFSAHFTDGFVWSGHVPTVIPYTTSATENLQAGPSLSLPGGVLQTSLPPDSVTTYAGHS
ncbi:MAG: hypothetical protein OWT28_05690 [Firmicutes bacterium]|nr:hypothetical protein [Bacillota bacterium]